VFAGPLVRGSFLGRPDVRVRSTGLDRTAAESTLTDGRLCAQRNWGNLLLLIDPKVFGLDAATFRSVRPTTGGDIFRDGD
jgi:hypothetical protein